MPFLHLIFVHDVYSAYLVLIVKHKIEEPKSDEVKLLIFLPAYSTFSNNNIFNKIKTGHNVSDNDKHAKTSLY